jgi:outer membrane protein
MQFAPAQDQIPRVDAETHGTWLGRLRAPYEPRTASPVSFSNSSRLRSLLRNGTLYLSLQDAIALALENNLDIELQRFGPAIAASDLLRARGGGLVRGVATAINEAPAGFGTTTSPLVTSAATGTTPTSLVPTNVSDLPFLNENQTNPSVLNNTQLSNGSPIPSYDPAIVGQLNLAHQTTPQTNTLVAGANALVTRNLIGNLGLQQGFSTGTQLGAAWNNTSQNTNSLRSNYNPYTNASLGFNITQPLLRGFGIGVNRRFIHIARNNEKVSDLVFRHQLIATISGVIRLYYDLVSLNEDVRVKQQTLALAQRLYEDNRTKVEQGTLAPIEVVRAQAQVAASRQDLVNSQSFVRQQELILKTVLTRRGTSDPDVRDARISPTDVIVVPQQENIQPIQDLISTALANRPELEEARLQLASSQLSLKGSRNALLPEIDLVGTVQNSGLAGELNPLASSNVLPSGTGGVIPIAPPPYVGGYGSALGQIFRRNYPTYGIGIQLNLPLRNRVAQADVIRDELQVRQYEVRQQQLANQIRLEVEDALVALERARTAYDAAVQTRTLQEQSLEIEQEKYAVGLSTTFLIVQYQSYVAQARSTEVAARSTYAKAKTALERAIGMTLENHGISMEDAYKGKTAPATAPAP